jgi:hypothetical protein
MQLIDSPIQQAEAGWFSRRELQDYLGVGKNALTAIAERFGLTNVDGCFDERDVWRRLLDLEPMHNHGVELLRIPLRDIDWIAGQLGKASSTVRNEISRGSFPFGCGVQLGDLSKHSPRTRRWCAPVFNAERRGIAIVSIQRAPQLTVADDAFGLPPLDDFAELSPAEIVMIEPPTRLWL